MRSLSTALTTIRRTPYQALVSILMVSVTFFVGYSFSLFIAGADLVLKHFETRPQIIAFFELDTPESQISHLEQTMRGKPYVKDVSVVTQEEALELYKSENKDDPLLLELVTADILPASIEVSAVMIDALGQIKQDLEGAQGVEDVIYQEDVISSLNQWTQSVRYIGLASVITLGTISFLIIMVMIAIKATHQKRAIVIMRILGATQWYIQSPFVVEGMVYGLVGSIIGWGGMYVALLYASPWIQEFLGDITVLPIPLEVLATQAAVGTGAGLFLGGFAGYLAARRLIYR